MGGFKIQGRGQGEADALVADALALEQAGAYSIVLEGIPTEIAARITESLAIPTIGIGAGPHCDGQVLVIYDLLGMDDSFKPKFVRRYEHLATRIRTAVDAYIADVRASAFPGEPETFFLDPGKQAAAPRATISALSHAGVCTPAADTVADTSAELSGLYSSVNK
jgi:3-methyl-2-oxobutanoate hydroxymethyltransferase